MKWLTCIFLSLLSSTALAAGSTLDFATAKQIHKCPFAVAITEKTDLCNNGTAPDGKPTMVLIGDSYSRSLVPMMMMYTKLATNAPSFAQYGRPACVPLLDAGQPHCAEFAQSLFTHITQTPSIKTVVMAAQWNMHYVDDEVPSNAENKKKRFLLALDNTIKAYQQKNLRVLIILEAPYGTPKACMPRGPIPVDPNKCGIDPKRADRRYLADFLTIAKQRGVQVFDPFKYFCDERWCKGVFNDQILYETWSHLSPEGGYYLARASREEWDRLLTSAEPKAAAPAKGPSKASKVNDKFRKN